MWQALKHLPNGNVPLRDLALLRLSPPALPLIQQTGEGRREKFLQGSLPILENERDWNAPRAFRSSSSPWKKPHANQLSYGSLAGMDKVTTHIMGLPSTAFTDGQPSFLKGLRVGGGGIHHVFFCLLFVWAMSNVVPRGLEPRTLRLLAVRSNQLSYETHWFHLAPGPASLPLRAPIC